MSQSPACFTHSSVVAKILHLFLEFTSFGLSSQMCNDRDENGIMLYVGQVAPLAGCRSFTHAYWLSRKGFCRDCCCRAHEKKIESNKWKSFITAIVIYGRQGSTSPLSIPLFSLAGRKIFHISSFFSQRRENVFIYMQKDIFTIEEDILSSTQATNNEQLSDQR